MSTTHKEKLAALSPERRARVERLTREGVAKVYALRDLRDLLGRSQVHIAGALGVDQSAVSKLERKADVYVGTLRRYVEAAGGTLEIVARFPGRPPVRVGRFGSPAVADAEPSAEEAQGPDPLAPGGPIA